MSNVPQKTAHARKPVPQNAPLGDTYAAAFSNQPGSRRSSLGLFRTADTYVGEHGQSLRLSGLEPGVNDRAMERAIVCTVPRT